VPQEPAAAAAAVNAGWPQSYDEVDTATIAFLFQGPDSSGVDVSWYYVDPDQQIRVRVCCTPQLAAIARIVIAAVALCCAALRYCTTPGHANNQLYMDLATRPICYVCNSAVLLGCAVQGPFSPAELVYWCSQQLLPVDLLVHPCGPGDALGAPDSFWPCTQPNANAPCNQAHLLHWTFCCAVLHCSTGPLFSDRAGVLVQSAAAACRFAGAPLRLG
jgi:hypothetical protein